MFDKAPLAWGKAIRERGEKRRGTEGGERAEKRAGKKAKSGKGEKMSEKNANLPCLVEDERSYLRR